MNKTQLIGEIIGQHPLELMIEILWDDPELIHKIETKLLEVSKDNLHPYYDHFVGQPIGITPVKAEHTPIYPIADKTIEYIRQSRS